MTLSHAQESSLLKARDILAEHFQAAVIIVQDTDEKNREGHWASTSGGFSSAMGLLEIGKLKMLERWNHATDKGEPN